MTIITKTQTPECDECRGNGEYFIDGEPQLCICVGETAGFKRVEAQFAAQLAERDAQLLEQQEFLEMCHGVLEWDARLGRENRGESGWYAIQYQDNEMVMLYVPHDGLWPGKPARVHGPIPLPGHEGTMVVVAHKLRSRIRELEEQLLAQLAERDARIGELETDLRRTRAATQPVTMSERDVRIRELKKQLEVEENVSLSCLAERDAALAKFRGLRDAVEEMGERTKQCGPEARGWVTASLANILDRFPVDEPSDPDYGANACAVQPACVRCGDDEDPIVCILSGGDRDGEEDILCQRCCDAQGGHGFVYSSDEPSESARSVNYSSHTTSAYGIALEALCGSDEQLQVSALKDVFRSVHCDLTGELREPHSASFSYNSDEPSKKGSE